MLVPAEFCLILLYATSISPPPPPPTSPPRSSSPAVTGKDPFAMADDEITAGEQAQAKRDFEGAISHLESAVEAAGRIPDESDRAEVTANALTKLVRAHLAAYDNGDRAPRHLAAAANALDLYSAVPSAKLDTMQELDAEIASRRRNARRAAASAAALREWAQPSGSAHPRQRSREPKAPDPRIRTAGIVMTSISGGLAIGLVTSGVVNARAVQDWKDFKADDPNWRTNPARDEFSDTRQRTGFATIALAIIGSATVIAGVTLLAVDSHRRATRKRSELRIVLVPFSPGAGSVLKF